MATGDGTPQPGIIFDARSGQRIKNAVAWVESQATDMSGSSLRPLSLQDRNFWARITDSQKKEDGGRKYHTYSWTEVIRDGDGWADRENARTGTMDDEDQKSYGINSEEAQDLCPAIPDGTVVEIKLGYDCSGDEPQATWTFQASVPGIFAVNLTMDGGSDGGIGSYCSYTYTVTDASTGDIIDTSIAPSHRRWQASCQTATWGLATMLGGTLILVNTDETPNTGGCA